MWIIDLMKWTIDLLPCRVMNNYLTWYMVHRSIDNLGSDFQFAQLILSKAVDGKIMLSALWIVLDHC